MVNFINKKIDEVVFSTSEDNAKYIIKNIDIMYVRGHQMLRNKTISIDDTEYTVDSIIWRNDSGNTLLLSIENVILIKKGCDDVSIS